MRVVLCLWALFLSAQSFSPMEYVFSPQGSFTITVTSAGPYYFTGFNLENGNICLCAEGQCVLYGSIEKINDPCCSYVFKLNHARMPYYSGILFDSLKKYEIRDERGGLIGHVEGRFSKGADRPFLFYDEQNRLFAKSTLNPSCSELTISTIEDRELIVCLKTFKYPGFSSNPDYYWTVKEVSDISFDSRFLWPFVAFVSEFYWESAIPEGYY